MITLSAVIDGVRRALHADETIVLDSPMAREYDVVRMEVNRLLSIMVNYVQTQRCKVNGGQVSVQDVKLDPPQDYFAEDLKEKRAEWEQPLWGCRFIDDFTMPITKEMHDMGIGMES